MNENLIYVYCITSLEPKLEKIQAKNPKELRVLNSGGFYALYKNVPVREYSKENLEKNLSDLEWVESKVREHIKVIGLVMNGISVIPCKFGTLFSSTHAMRRFLADYSFSLKENLSIVEGREEWSVKVFSYPEKVSDQIVSLSNKVRELDTKITESSPGKSFLLKKKRMDVVEQEVERISQNHGQNCFDRLNAVSKLNSISKPLSRELSGREGEMILNAAFMVEKSKVGEFQEIADSLKKEHQSAGFDLECSGPWPPFNFISLNHPDGTK